MVSARTLPARRLEVADLSWATALLEAAGASHPVLNYCCTGPQAHAQRMWLLGHLLRFGMLYGRVYTNGDNSALAVWLGPNYPVITWPRLLCSGLLPAAMWRLGWAGFQRLRRFLVASIALRKQSLAVTSHHYLLALAVHPADQGKGRGRRLLQATLAAMQATHVPCYLDTQWSAQLLFFQRLGFRLLGQCPAGPGVGAPINWGLIRDGRA